MNSLTWLVTILLTLSGLVVGLAVYIVWKRNSSVREFVARQRGQEIMKIVSHGPKPKIRYCGCCGRKTSTSGYRPNCLRNAANAQKRV